MNCQTAKRLWKSMPQVNSVLQYFPCALDAPLDIKKISARQEAGHVARMKYLPQFETFSLRRKDGRLIVAIPIVNHLDFWSFLQSIKFDRIERKISGRSARRDSQSQDSDY